jgi:hypothetical protein
MADCPRCGRQVSASNSFCEYCGGALAPSPGGVVFERGTGAAEPLGAAAQLAAPITQYDQFPMPAAADAAGRPPFRLAFDETILKTYEAVVLRTPIFKRIRGRGTLYVTDARVVFHARINPRGTMRASRLIQQTKLEDISGLSASVTRRLSLLLIALTVLFVLAFIGALSGHSTAGAVICFILAVVFGALLAIDARNRGKVAVTIKSRENDNSPIGFGYGARLGARNAYDLIRGKPGEDADLLVHELGALILDLQTRGTTAYAHWGITESGDRARRTGTL